MGDIFVSIMGTQTMGALQNWLACMENHGELSCRIFYTPQTEARARKICDYAAENALPEPILAPVFRELDSGKNSIAELMKSLGEEADRAGARIYFNLDGSMNYLINAAVLALKPFRPVLVQSSRWRYLEYDSASEEWTTGKFPGDMSAEELLNIQEIEYSPESANPDVCENLPFFETCEKNKIRIPRNSLKNVKIDGIVFDLVWNPGNNRLCYLKDWRFWINDRNEKKIRERDLANWSMSRKRANQQFDRQIYVLVGNKQSEERLAKESGGQIAVRRVENEVEFAAAVKDCFRFKAKGGKVEKLLPPEPSRAPELRDGTLVVCAGTNLISTLTAICSRKPRHLALCHTPGDAAVAAHVERIKQNAADLGLLSVEAVKFDIEGTFPDQNLPPLPHDRVVDVDVNISPGSKGQGVMLLLWAVKHGFTAWSLHNGKRKCVPFFNPAGKSPQPFDICDPALCFRLLGNELLSAGLNEKDLEPDLPRYDSLLQFLREALAAGKDKDALNAPVRVGNSVLRPAGGSRRTLETPAARYEFTEEKGQWFERLAAAAILRAGASHVRVNCALRWNDENEREIYQKNHIEGLAHRLELDVVASLDGDLVLISCKSNPDEPGEAAAKEANDTAANLGRFCLPLLAHMGCDETHYIHDVAVIGWRELCRPGRLREIVKELRLARKKVN